MGSLNLHHVNSVRSEEIQCHKIAKKCFFVHNITIDCDGTLFRISLYSATKKNLLIKTPI